jgi:cephalosporin-C deacetylase-like acetyl esterase
MLDVAFYDQNYKAQIVRGIVLSENQELNTITLSEHNITYPVKAIVINHNDYAYDKVRFDDISLINLENNLYKIDEYLTRSIIWK